MNIVRYKSAKTFLMLMVIVMSVCTIAGVLCFGSYGNVGGKPVEAADTYASQSWSGRPTDSSYKTAYAKVYMYYDNTYGTLSVPSDNMTYAYRSSYVQFYWSYNFTFTPASGVAWSSSAPTSWTIKYKNAEDQDSSSYYTTLWSNIQSGSYSSITFTRSGNTFTASGTHTFDVDTTTSASCYGFWVGWLELSSSYFTYEITFNSNGGSSCASQTATSNISAGGCTYGTLPTPTKTGFDFGGWYTDNAFTGAQVSPTDIVISSHVLYARWISYNVVFNSNGGSACATQNYQPSQNSTYGTLPTPTKTGCSFMGWYLTDDFKGSPVTTDSAVTSSHTLYAKWVSISFETNGGTACAIQGIDSSTGTYGTLPTTTKLGYTFDGWYKTSNFIDSPVATTTLVSESHTLYAKWTSTLNLDLQGGSMGTYSVTGTYGMDMPSATAPIRMGYTFGGYFTGKNGTGTRYYTNSMASSHLNDLPNGTTLYAYWMINTYILYYNPNGGTVSSTEASVTFGSTVTPPTPTRTGYTFFGWYIGTERYSGGIWTFTENKTATAKWGYTLTYNANGGNVLPGSVTLTDGDVITPPVPTRDGCTFAGWKIGSSAYYGGLWAFTANQTAVAQWNCNLTAYCAEDQQGYITGSADGVYAVGTSVTLTANPESGYAFDCWVVNNRKVKTATYTGAINLHTTAVAYFTKTQPTANVYATNGTIASTYLNVEPDTYSATLRISPETGKYIESISFDNVAYYTIDSWSTTLYASSSFAQNVAYRANEGNNDLWLTFNYYNTNKTVNVYVNLTTTKYSNLNVPKNTGGALDGIAVSANYGGSVTLVGADYETLADSDEIICTAKLAQEGYEFVGWVFADSQSNILSTEESAKFTKATIYGRQLMAKFQPTADNPDYNMELNN